MPVTFDEVRRIASLAGLRSAPGEEDEVAQRMAEIVEFAGGMSTVVAEQGAGGEGSPGEAVPPEAEEIAEEIAGDVPGECLDRNLVLANAPDHEDGFVRLPPIRWSRSDGGAREGTE